MELSFVKLLFDFGLLVLIWMVQLIVYPSFTYMDKQRLIVWHSKYSKGISAIVIPLMLGQLVLSVMLLLREISLSRLIDLLLLISVWAVTFIIFVPTHQAISTGNGNAVLLKKLVTKNWSRTVIWTTIFLFNLGMVISN